MSSVQRLLSVSSLSVEYGAVRVLGDASLEVRQGEIVAMIGPNGAGKSTCLRAISGILHHYDGKIAVGDVVFEGKRINGMPPHRLIKLGLALVPENRHVFPSMTVLENLEMGAYTVGSRCSGVEELKGSRRQQVRERLDQVFELFPRLAERKKQRAGTLSTGEQQMLAMGRGLMIRPRVLLIDEPTVGLSPNFVDQVFDKLQEINRAGTSVLLVEQNARMALEVCNRAYVFEVGKIAFDGPRKDLIEDPRIKKAYLGG